MAQQHITNFREAQKAVKTFLHGITDELKKQDESQFKSLIYYIGAFDQDLSQMSINLVKVGMVMNMIDGDKDLICDIEKLTNHNQSIWFKKVKEEYEKKLPEKELADYKTSLLKKFIDMQNEGITEIPITPEVVDEKKL